MTYKDTIKKIIKEMEKIIGPVAKTQANQVNGLHINKTITLTGDPKKIMDNLILRYKSIMGPVALTIAKKATGDKK